MLARLEVVHDVVVAHDGRYWHGSTRQSLSKYHDIGSNLLVIDAQHLKTTRSVNSATSIKRNQHQWRYLASSSKTCLDLIGSKEHVVLGAQLTHLFEISLIWNHDAGLALDWLDIEAGNVVVGLEQIFESLDIVVGHNVESSTQTNAIRK
jgi:hypothetical protein